MTALWSKLRVHSFSLSLEGYGAGPDQSIDNPLGVGGPAPHEWAFPTHTLQRVLFNNDGGTTGVDDDFVARGFEGIASWILGRDDVPLRHRRHRGRADRGKAAAKGKDIRLGGGVATIRQYLQARLIDEMHIAVTSVPLGAGENLFADLDLPQLGYQTVERVPSQAVTHIVLAKQG